MPSLAATPRSRLVRYCYTSYGACHGFPLIDHRGLMEKLPSSGCPFRARSYDPFPPSFLTRARGCSGFLEPRGTPGGCGPPGARWECCRDEHCLLLRVLRRGCRYSIAKNVKLRSVFFLPHRPDTERDRPRFAETAVRIFDGPAIPALRHTLSGRCWIHDNQRAARARSNSSITFRSHSRGNSRRPHPIVGLTEDQQRKNAQRGVTATSLGLHRDARTACRRAALRRARSGDGYTRPVAEPYKFRSLPLSG